MLHVKGMDGKKRKGKAIKPVIEALERRLHFTITNAQVDTEGHDTSSLFWQGETSNINFVPPGATAPNIVVVHTDTSAGASSAPHEGNFAYSTDGGSSFTAPANNLPTPTSGDQKGDGGNVAIARDDSTGKIYMVSLSNSASPQRVIQLLDLQPCCSLGDHSDLLQRDAARKTRQLQRRSQYDRPCE